MEGSGRVPDPPLCSLGFQCSLLVLFSSFSLYSLHTLRQVGLGSWIFLCSVFFTGDPAHLTHPSTFTSLSPVRSALSQKQLFFWNVLCWEWELSAHFLHPAGAASHPLSVFVYLLKSLASVLSLAVSVGLLCIRSYNPLSPVPVQTPFSYSFSDTISPPHEPRTCFGKGHFRLLSLPFSRNRDVWEITL